MKQAMALLTFVLAAQARPSTGKEIPGWHLSGSDRTNYSISLDRASPYEGETSACLSSTAPTPTGFGTLMQELSSEALKGRRVRFAAYVKSEGVDNWAGLWMRVDGTGESPLAFDNMRDRPIRGDTPWAPYSIVLDVPHDATGIAYGVVLTGSGRVWLDSITFDVVANIEPTTAMPLQTKARAAPFNVGFEE